MIRNLPMPGLTSARRLPYRAAIASSMPWQGDTKLSDDDVEAIVVYLRSIKSIQHKVPAPVNMGEKAHNPYVYFGVYRSKP